MTISGLAGTSLASASAAVGILGESVCSEPRVYHNMECVRFPSHFTSCSCPNIWLELIELQSSAMTCANDLHMPANI
ncbi:hypothetical protein MRB53_039733 [Persea americana]|nr:hypothetical protein MRB53_039733 [Persea americana]